jgi:hydroxypyruvate isomerase
VHAADRPGRHEPGSGTIDWPAAMAALRREGYAGPVGLEFNPSVATQAALASTREALA